jgi:hypothetical protein
MSNLNERETVGVTQSKAASIGLPSQLVSLRGGDCVCLAHDEVDLLAMGSQLEELAKELKVVITWVEEVAELFNEEVERNATWPADQNMWTLLDARAYWEARCRLEKGTEIGAAFTRAVEAQEALYRRIDPLCQKIGSLRPRTKQERELKRWARAIETGAWPARELEASADEQKPAR